MDESIKEVVGYCPGTGHFFWNKDFSIKAKKGKEAGTITEQGYRRIKVYGRNFLAHRLAVFFVKGSPPEEQVDHEDGDGGNNRWTNLREACPGLNSRNRKRYATNTSGYPGVRKAKSGKWQAACQVGSKSHHLGYFSCLEEAAKAVIEFRRESGLGYSMRDFSEEQVINVKDHSNKEDHVQPNFR